MSLAARFAAFVADASPPETARRLAGRAVIDTVGVALAGAGEPAAEAVRRALADEGSGPCTVFGVPARAGAVNAALANGTAAHALDFDDMCFVSLAHPSAPLVPALFAAGEIAGASGRAVLDAYVVGFEIEAVLGRTMNPAHYRRGWHSTSTLGTIGAAAAASRLLGLGEAATAHALAIAASEASGCKENFGSMVKPLHAGLAARNGVQAALLARAGVTAGARAFEGPQGFLAVMDSARRDVDPADLADLGRRWEIIESGITVKLYPSCAATHPAIDAVLDLRRQERFAAEDVERIDVDVDALTPTVLLYDQPMNGLEARFSMPFCLASAVVDGGVTIGSFEAGPVARPAVAGLMARVAMRTSPDLEGAGAPLTQSRVRIALADGRVLEARADGARGYPSRPASDEELDAKFLDCASRALPREEATGLLTRLRALDTTPDLRSIRPAR